MSADRLFAGVFAMDTYFYTSLGAYAFDVRCEMLAELGYDATYLTLWSAEAEADIPRLAYVKARYGLDVAGVYMTLDIASAPAGSAAHVLELIETLPIPTQVAVALYAEAPGRAQSDATLDDQALPWIERLLAVADRHGHEILLYPHFAFWLERTEDAVRLCRRLAHPRLGLSFNGYHWYAVDGKQLSARLDEAAPYLRSANICGSRRLPEGSGPMPATIEPLDDGELDNFIVLAELQRIGYRGWIGFQGYSVGGDVYTKLQRSLTAYRSMITRLVKRPGWGVLRM
ncbi:MAG: sugar phosphate isomerase/epimerase family protein [Caldilinea sp.]